MLVNQLYYTIRPFVPRILQIAVRRRFISHKLPHSKHKWPIDESAANPPNGWPGWPNGKRFALVLIHDVDTQKGYDNILPLIQLEENLQFKSSINIVPEKYPVSMQLIQTIKERGFGVGVHGLIHDGKLYFSKRIFDRRAKRINYYFKKWGSRTFSSPCMHHNLAWMHALDSICSTTTFDTDPFEPQNDPVGTIFPFWVQPNPFKKGYIELPYTLPQDFTLFVLMKESTNNIWKSKLDWIAAKGGMVLLNSHPDYMNFSLRKKSNFQEYSVGYFTDFLRYIKRRYNGKYWLALPEELAEYCRSNRLNSEKT